MFSFLNGFQAGFLWDYASFTAEQSHLKALKSYTHPSVIQPLIFLPKTSFPLLVFSFPSLCLIKSALRILHRSCFPKMSKACGFCSQTQYDPGKRCVPVLWFWDQPPHRQVRLNGDADESNKIPLEALAPDSYWPQLLKHSLLWPWQTSAYCYVFKMLLWIFQFEQLVTLFVSAHWLPPSAMVLSFLRLIWFHFIFRSIPF